MFYVTKIQAINGGTVTDTTGRRLQFIGDLPAKVGDTICTDGKYVFGHAPPKGSPAIFDEPGGIPVLADDLRGYFSKQGTFKNYTLKGSKWIVNDKKYYKHDDSDADIIDADIINGKLFTVKGGSLKESQVLEIHHPVLILRGGEYGTFHNSSKTIPQIQFSAHVLIPKSYPMILGSENFGNEHTPIEIFSDGKKISEFDLEPCAKDIQKHALNCAEQILQQSYNQSDIVPYISFKEITDRYKFFFQTVYGKESYPDAYFVADDATEPPNTFIAHTCAHILFSNFNDENFSAFIFAAAYGYCFPFIQSRFFYRFFPIAFKEEYQIYDFAPNYEDFALREWKAVPFGASAIYQFQDGKIVDTLFCKGFGGIDSDLAFFDNVILELNNIYAGHEQHIASDDDLDTYDLKKIVKYRRVKISVDYEKGSDNFIPVGDGFFKLNHFGQLIFFNSNQEEIAKIPVNEDCCFFQMQQASYHDTLDRNNRYASLINREWKLNGLNRFRFTCGDKPDYFNLIKYSPDEQKEDAKIYLSAGVEDSSSNPVATNSSNYSAHDDCYATVFPPVDNFYILDGSDTPLHFTPLFSHFKNESCLFGVKDGKLYQKINKDVEVIADGLKNFRLRKLKKISKAKK